MASKIINKLFWSLITYLIIALPLLLLGIHEFILGLLGETAAPISDLGIIFEIGGFLLLLKFPPIAGNNSNYKLTISKQSMSTLAILYIVIGLIIQLGIFAENGVTYIDVP